MQWLCPILPIAQVFRSTSCLRADAVGKRRKLMHLPKPGRFCSTGLASFLFGLVDGNDGMNAACMQS